MAQLMLNKKAPSNTSACIFSTQLFSQNTHLGKYMPNGIVAMINKM